MCFERRGKRGEERKVEKENKKREENTLTFGIRGPHAQLHLERVRGERESDLCRRGKVQDSSNAHRPDRTAAEPTDHASSSRTFLFRISRLFRLVSHLFGRCEKGIGVPFGFDLLRVWQLALFKAAREVSG